MNSLLELYREIHSVYISRMNIIYEVFKEQFGEENVDMQNLETSASDIPDYINVACSHQCDEEGKRAVIWELLRKGVIYVHWPFVRVTNEYDKYTDIKDLWAEVIISPEGKLANRFKLNRSNYTYLHISSGYMHSHVSSIPFNNFCEFQTPCTGSGPINGTMSSLLAEYDIDLWRLFCCELNNYVTVESIAGVPYHRLENIGQGSCDIFCERLSPTAFINNKAKRLLKVEGLRSFVTFAIEAKPFKFAYHSNAYTLGVSFAESVKALSDLFINWINRNHNRYPNITLPRLLESGILYKGFYSGGKIYMYARQNRNYSSYVGAKVLTFKGRDITLSIDNLIEAEHNLSYFLSQDLVNFIITAVLKTLNYRYGRERTETESEHSFSASEIFI